MHFRDRKTSKYFRKNELKTSELNFLKAGVLRDKIIMLEKKLDAIKKRTK